MNGHTGGQTQDRHNAMTIARWPLASGAKNHTCNKTSILKVLHGSTKSPNSCMYSWRYNILLEVKEGI